MSNALNHYNNLRAAFLEPGIDDVKRTIRGRDLADGAVDLQRGITLASAILPGLTHAAMRGYDELQQVLQERHTFDELRDLADFAGLNPKLSGGNYDGTTNGLPLIRTIATTYDGPLSHAPVVPAVTDDPTLGTIDPTTYDDDPGETPPTITIEDAGENETWHVAAIAAEISRQVYDYTTPKGQQVLDQTLFDIVDRTAETYIVDELSDVDTTPIDGTTDLVTAIDTAESAAGAALGSPADMLIVSPTDLPAVRRAVATSWQLGPAPSLYVSAGAVAGTAVLTGRQAFTLYRQDYVIDRVERARLFAHLVGLTRPFYLAVKNADAVQQITITDPEA